MSASANPLALLEGETSVPFADSEPAPCNCDQSRALAAELAIVKAQRDYLIAFCDPREIRAMQVELAAEHGEPASGEAG